MEILNRLWLMYTVVCMISPDFYITFTYAKVIYLPQFVDLSVHLSICKEDGWLVI